MQIQYDITYRGKTKDNKWIKGYLLKMNGVPYIINTEEISKYNNDGFSVLLKHIYEVIPESIGVKTGESDANGNDIYTGDILNFWDKIAHVQWNDEKFQLFAFTKTFVTSCYQQYVPSLEPVNWDYIDISWINTEKVCTGRTDVEIIGNIYDNPELMPDYAKVEEYLTEEYWKF